MFRCFHISAGPIGEFSVVGKGWSVQSSNDKNFVVAVPLLLHGHFKYFLIV